MKQKRYWLKGGIILFVLSGISGLLDYRCLLHTEYFSFDCIPFEIPSIIRFLWPRWLLSIDYFPNDTAGIELHQNIVIIATVISWTIVGMLAGWLYGKIKNRNKVS